MEDTKVSTILASLICGSGNSSGMSVIDAPAALPMPRARWPALRPIATTKYQRPVVRASVIRFSTSSTKPMCRAVWNPNVLGVAGEIEVVVDGLRHVHDAHAPLRRALDARRREARVVAADRHELVDAEPFEARDRGLERALATWSGSARAMPEVGAAAEVDEADVVHRERLHVLDVALHDVGEAVADADDFAAPESSARIVAAPMTLLMPGAGPPPTRMPIFLAAWLMRRCYHSRSNASSSAEVQRPKL